MNVSNCPRCADQIRVPSGNLSPDSYAQCPWCGETFPLSEVLDRLPPVLTLLTADGMPVEAARQANVTLAVGANQASPAAPDEFLLSSQQPSDDFTTALVEDRKVATNSPVQFDPPVRSDRQPGSGLPLVPSKRSRKSGGGLRSLLGIVGGGLLSIPIVVVILWGLGRFGIGPLSDNQSVSNDWVASRPVEMASQRQPLESPLANDLDPVERPSAVSVTSESVTGDPAFVLPEVDALATDTEGLSLDSASQAPTGTEATPSDVQSTDLETTDPKLTELETGDVEPQGVTPSGITGAELEPPGESAELVAKVRRAEKMIDALNKFQGEETKRLRWLTTAYQTIAGASEMATADGASIRALADSIETSAIVDDLDRAGAAWLEQETRESDGVLLFGDSDGQSLTLRSGQRVRVSGAVSLPPAGRVLVIGRILDKQSVNAVLVQIVPRKPL